MAMEELKSSSIGREKSKSIDEGSNFKSETPAEGAEGSCGHRFVNCDQSGAGLAPPNDDDESSPPNDEDDESVLENVPTDWRRKLRGLDGSRVFPSID